MTLCKQWAGWSGRWGMVVWAKARRSRFQPRLAARPSRHLALGPGGGELIFLAHALLSVVCLVWLLGSC
jgi:hypothetical protein